MLTQLEKVMSAENRTEELVQEGNRSIGKMLQGPVRDTVRDRSRADLESLMAS